MLTFIVLLYSVVGLIGIYLAVKLFSKQSPKLLIGIVHGSIGLAGLALLIGYISFQKAETPIYGFLFLLVAFFFGGGMIATTLTGKKFPKIIAIIHILVALTGLYFLISFWRNIM